MLVNCSLSDLCKDPAIRLLSSDHQLQNIHHRKSAYNHLIFPAKDYTKLLEKIRLPLETKWGTVLDESFMHKFEEYLLIQDTGLKRPAHLKMALKKLVPNLDR